MKDKTYRCTYCGCKEVPYDTEICPKCNLQPIPPFKEESKLKILDVIGGLEKKKEDNTNWKMNYECGKKNGHNQLCNREVDVDTDEIEKIFIEHIVCQFAHKEELGGYTRALIKAISQGKVIKVVKNVT